MKSPECITIHCLYCDDIREEVDEKQSIIGWYRKTEIKLPDEGLFLPIFCIVTIIQVPISVGVEALVIELMQNDNVVQRLDTPVNTLHEKRMQRIESSSEKNMQEIAVNIKLANFGVRESTNFYVRVTVNDEVLIGNKMSFV